MIFALFILAFICGALPFSVWVGRLALQSDIRDFGDNNPGATNVMRAGGWGWGALALLLDYLKGAVPVGIVHFTLGIAGWPLAIIAIAPVLGHAFSPFLKFRGGKAIATTFGIWTGLTVYEGPIVLGIFLGLGFLFLAVDGWAVMVAMLGLLLYFLVTPASFNILGARPELIPTLLAAWAGNMAIVTWKQRADLWQVPRAAPLAAWRAQVMIILILFVAAALFFMLIVSLINAATFPRLRPARPTDPSTLVSVLIPARNESAVIAATISRLVAQTYAPLEILLLDDHSDDDTATLARTAAAAHPGFHLFPGKELPPGWLGKNWACHQLSQQARGDILIFADADVAWQPDAVAALVAQMQAADAGLLAVWPTQQTVTWGERLVVPLMALTIMAYLPLPLVHHTPWRAFAAANGQCLAFRRRTYDAVGGHKAVRAAIIEDVKLARNVKAAGERLRMVDASGLITCRMYDGWPAVRDGYAKNIIAGFGGIPALLLATAFHWLVFLLPWLWLILGWLNPTAGWPIVPLILIGMGLLVRAITAAATRQRARDALLMPLSVLMMTIIAAKALWWQWRQGGPSWKGRVLNTNPS